MGWNSIKVAKENPILEINVFNKFYFVHSYFVKCNSKHDILTTTEYSEEFVSSFKKDNIYGVQFHPEKSHKYGLSLIKKFMTL